MADLPPDWAIERAVAVMQLSDAWAVEAVKEGCVVFSKNVLHVARYISQHEQPPVDPLLIEAREIAARHCRPNAYISFSAGKGSAERIREGLDDDSEVVQLTLAALRRGLSLSQGGGNADAPDPSPSTQGTHHV